jgi:hypothetical protein
MYLPLQGLGFATVLKGMYERCERLVESANPLGREGITGYTD